MLSANLVTKVFVIKKARTCHLLCKKPGCYHSTNKTQVTCSPFKLIPIHDLVIFRFPEFTEIIEFNEISAPFRKNSIIFSEEFSFYQFEGHQSFCGATDTPVLNFWVRKHTS